MNCEITGAEWTDYLDQAMSFRDRQRIESHLRVCANCRSELDVLRQIDQRLRIECGLIRQSIGVPAGLQAFESRAASREQVLEVLRQVTSKGENDRLWRVRWVLSLLCGSNTAPRIIAAAESHSGLSANAKPSEQKWLQFLRRLSFLTTEICGSHAGDLIWAVGQ